MKITKSQLKQIIKEEIQAALSEQSPMDRMRRRSREMEDEMDEKPPAKPVKKPVEKPAKKAAERPPEKRSDTEKKRDEMGKKAKTMDPVKALALLEKRLKKAEEKYNAKRSSIRREQIASLKRQIKAHKEKHNL